MTDFYSSKVTNWAEEVESERAPDTAEINLPKPQIEYNPETGEKRVIEYKINNDGKPVKVITVYKVEVRKTTPVIASRMKLQKFGASANDPPGPNVANTSSEEEIPMQFITGKDQQEESEDGLKSKLKGKAVMSCRVCKSTEHLTHSCPYRDMEEALRTLKLGVTAGAPGGPPMPAPSAYGSRSLAGMVAAATQSGPAGRPPGEGAYRPPVPSEPPSLLSTQTSKPGSYATAAKTAPSATYRPPTHRTGPPTGGPPPPRGARGDEYKLRVSNLTEDATENDLKELFSPFGQVVHVQIPRTKDSVKRAKGFAFVSFATRDAAEKALAGVNNYGYNHLILKVDWATPLN